MPSVVAASRMVVPSGTLTSVLSMRSSISAILISFALNSVGARSVLCPVDRREFAGIVTFATLDTAILVDLEDWSQALEALNKAIDKGGLTERRTGEAYLLRGMTQFNLQNFDAAGADWNRASRYENTRSAARQWINHLREERLRRAS